jgi:hypothetical protein
MFIRVLASLLFIPFCFCVDFSAPAFGQEAASNASTVQGTPATPPVAPSPNWLPPDVDAKVPPVEPESPCKLDEVLRHAGRRIQELVENVQRFTATESLLHESINKAGAVAGTEHRKYDYVVSIEEIQPGSYGVEEFLRSGSSPIDYPGGKATTGLPALILIFHPYYSGDFAMTCEGLGTLHGKKAWQVYFRQKTDKPNRIRSYRIGNGPGHPVDLKGRAWFLADSYQIAALQTDLVHPLPDIQLVADHTVVEYDPVHFGSRGVDMWLPQTAEVYSEWKGKRIHRRLSFSDYFLFAVDDKYTLSPPTPIP